MAEKRSMKLNKSTENRNIFFFTKNHLFKVNILYIWRQTLLLIESKLPHSSASRKTPKNQKHQKRTAFRGQFILIQKQWHYVTPLQGAIYWAWESEIPVVKTFETTKFMMRTSKLLTIYCLLLASNYKATLKQGHRKRHLLTEGNLPYFGNNETGSVIHY